MRAILLLTLALLLGAAPTLGEACRPTTSEPEVAFADFYIDNDFCFPQHCIFSIWLYQESNGFAGLQRNDDYKDDTCGGMIESDIPWPL